MWSIGIYMHLESLGLQLECGCEFRMRSREKALDLNKFGAHWVTETGWLCGEVQKTSPLSATPAPTMWEHVNTWKYSMHYCLALGLYHSMLPTSSTNQIVLFLRYDFLSAGKCNKWRMRIQGNVSAHALRRSILCIYIPLVVCTCASFKLIRVHAAAFVWS